ncbi:hypothetical protein RB4957 [Rhodopirellula baltica SH 1]|uniref:Uncharacterized protein n=1 Tax=Rhodopirellula baltica (strain DSM 10527 / NCIMB 13988 / SH1) TaxID=243090 RepID=Q7UGY1_RHOBA|nr:hypothetical protein RB4957 [Rhodopirellula baltica SH 1]
MPARPVPNDEVNHRKRHVRASLARAFFRFEVVRTIQTARRSPSGSRSERPISLLISD